MPQTAFNSSPANAANGSAEVRKWSDRSITPEERLAFLEDTVAPGNLQRAIWLAAVYLPVTLVMQIVNWFAIQDNRLGSLAYLDVAVSAGALLLMFHVLRRAAAIKWKRHLVTAVYVYNIGVMVAYYLAALPRFGDTSYYTLGLFMMAVLIHLPPRQFIPLLLAIHAAYCALVLWFASGDPLTAGLANGTNAVILAALASWFLFHRDWENYEKSRVITKRNLALAAANERLGEIMAIAAHDLRSPIASLRTYTEILHDEPEWKKAPYAQVLKEWDGILDGLLGLIGRILSAHRIESRSIPGERKQVPVSVLLWQCTARLEHSATAKGIGFEIQADDSLTVKTEPDMLEQALMNLLSNAIKFSPHHSRVLVTARKNDSTCEIKVQDAGPGIPHGEEKRLFSKFHRGRNQPTGGETSTGLGLFIVRQIMSSLGGRVTYERAAPTGSIFTLRLPL